MKKIALLLTLSMCMVATLATAQEVSSEESTTDLPFVMVEQMPLFPGGIDGLTKYLTETIVYPAKAAENGIFGKVYVAFVIMEDGSVSNIKILRGVDSLLDAEAIRVISQMPKWQPGVQGGKIVKVSYSMPINFKLSKEVEQPTKVLGQQVKELSNDSIK